MTPDQEPIHTARTILFTDIVGSTQFFASEGNKAGLEMIKRHNQYLFPVIESANGRIIKTIGDSIMAVFEHPTDALKSAFQMQAKLSAIRQSESQDKNLHIRIGIHYGLVNETNNDVFGDAVNIANRIKTFAEPNMVIVSHTLRELLKVDHRFSFNSRGKHELKGSPEPMELFELTQAPEIVKSSFPAQIKKRTIKTLKKRFIFIPIILLVLTGTFLVRFALSPSLSFDPNAIAVLPFRNLNNDSGTDYLSVALTAELNTQLLKIESLVIRPLSSALPYKDKNWDAKEVAKKLEVGKIISGSFIRSGDGLRVNVEIIDIAGNKKLSVEPYQGKVTDTLGLLDQTARQVVNTLRLRIMENSDVFKYGTDNIQAYDEYLRGVALLSGKMTKENNLSAIGSFETAIGLDPKFARAYAALAQAYATHFWWNFSNDTIWLDKGEDMARKSLAIDKNLIEGHHSLAYALEGKGKRADAIREYMVCFRLNQRYVPALTYLARYAFYMGESDLALAVLERIARIDPTQNIHMRRAINLFFAGRTRESYDANYRAEMRAEGVDELTLIGTTYAWLGDLKATERILRKLESVEPQALSIAELKAWLYTLQGKPKNAQEEMARFSMRESWGIKQEMAALYALQGEKEKALEWLTKAVASGGPSYAWFKSDHYKILKENKQYQELIKKLEDEYAPLRTEFKELISIKNP